MPIDRVLIAVHRADSSLYFECHALTTVCWLAHPLTHSLSTEVGLAPADLQVRVAHKVVRVDAADEERQLARQRVEAQLKATTCANAMPVNCECGCGAAWLE